MDTYMQGSHEECIFILCEDDCAAYAPSSHTMGCHIAASIGWLGVEVTVRRSVALSSECWRDLEVMTYVDVVDRTTAKAVTCQRHPGQTQSASRSFRIFSPQDLGTICRTLSLWSVWGRLTEVCIVPHLVGHQTGRSPGKSQWEARFRGSRMLSRTLIDFAG